MEKDKNTMNPLNEEELEQVTGGFEDVNRLPPQFGTGLRKEPLGDPLRDETASKKVGIPMSIDL